MSDHQPTELEGEGYAHIRGIVLPAAQGILSIDGDALEQAIDFALRGCRRLEARGTDPAQLDRSRNELDVLRAGRNFRKELEKLAQGQTARARVLEG